jgi:hypothetical protein
MCMMALWIVPSGAQSQRVAKHLEVTTRGGEASAPANVPPNASAVDIALQYLREHAADLGLTPGDIADQIKATYGIELDRRRVGDHPLRELGEFSVPVRLEAGLAPTLRVVIFREGQDPREGAAIETAEAVAEPMEEVAVAEDVVDAEDAAPADVDLAEETPSA